MLKSNKCPNCAGFYEFSPKDGMLKCTNCGATSPIDCSDTIPQHDYESTKTNYNDDWTKDAKHLKCQNCGANVLINRYSLLDKCSYCGSAMLVDIKQEKTIQPDAVLPFTIDTNQAKTFFQEGLKGKMFVPNILKKQTPKVNFTPRYVNAYVFNGSLVAKYSGRLEYSETTTDRDGHTHTTTYTKNVSGEIPHRIVDLVIESSTNLSQRELNKILPYDLSKLKTYSGEFLFGSSAEYSNKSLEDANRELTAIVKTDLTNRIVHKHHADRARELSLDLNYSTKNYCYCLLPTYILDYEYKKKHYTTLMNGTTGKLGGGIPKSTLKITLFALAIVLGILGIGLLFFVALDIF